MYSVKIEDSNKKIYANIEVSGLTVITGENNTGKTEVCKNINKQIEGSIFIDSSYLGSMCVNPDKMLIQFQKIFDNIEKIIGGRIGYDHVAKTCIKMNDDSGSLIKEKDLPSGIRVFVKLQHMLRESTIKEGTTLILDQTDVYLHPQWQLEYAQILVQLVEVGVNIVISTHSHYVVEALKTYYDNTKFYFGKKTEDGKVFYDCTNDLEQMFESFTKPMRKMALQ